MDAAERSAAILAVVSSISKGDVLSYSEVARRAGLPGYARYVATVLKRLPNGSQVPWHRVVNASGQIAFAEGSDGFERQRKCLADEGWTLRGSKLLSVAAQV